MRGGTASSDNLDLSPNSVAFDPDNTGRVRIQGGLSFKQPTDISSAVTASGVYNITSFSETVSAAGQTIIALLGFSFTPLIRYNAAQLFTAASAFAGSEQFSENAAIGGAHTDFQVLGFQAGPTAMINHNSTMQSIPVVAAFDAEPKTARDASSTTGTVLVARMLGFGTNIQQTLRAFFSNQQLKNSTVTTYEHFSAGSGGSGELLLSTATITTEVGLDLRNISRGSTNISIRSDSTTATMRHQGNVILGNGIATAPSFLLDVFGVARISGSNTLRFGGTGASDSTASLASVSNGLRIAGINGAQNRSVDFLLQTANQVTVAETTSNQKLYFDFREVITGDTDTSTITLNGTSVQPILQSNFTATPAVFNGWIFNSANNDADGLATGRIIICKSRGSLASPAVVAAQDNIAQFVIAGFDGTDFHESGRWTWNVPVGSTVASNSIQGGFLLELYAGSVEHSFFRMQGNGTDNAFSKFNGATRSATSAADVDFIIASTNQASMMFMDCSADTIGFKTNAPVVTIDINGGLATRSSGSIVNLTADNQTVTVGDRSYIRLASDSAVAGDRTFILTQSTRDGHRLVLEWTGTNAAELVDDSAQSGGGNHRLSATWTPTQYDTLELISNGTDWVEITRSTN